MWTTGPSPFFEPRVLKPSRSLTTPSSNFVEKPIADAILGAVRPAWQLPEHDREVIAAPVVTRQPAIETDDGLVAAFRGRHMSGMIGSDSSTGSSIFSRFLDC